MPFEDDFFDIIINEAMLTMLPNEVKSKALSEYFRVLKPNGILLTHNVLLKKDDQSIVDRLREAINVKATPLAEENWKNLLNNASFGDIKTFTGDMTLLSLTGLVHDEGIFGALKIIRNVLKKRKSCNISENVYDF